MTTFRATEVCAMTGITYRQIDYWDRVGMLTPSAGTARGQGTVRRYTRDDLVTAFVVKQLLDAGVDLGRARQVVTALRHVEEFEPRYVIIAEGGVSVAADPTSLAEDIDTAGGATTIVVRLDHINQQVDEAVSQLRVGRALAIAGAGR